MQTIPSISLVAYVRKSIQVDDAMEAPALESVLFDILASPVPAPDYRNALHANLPVEDATKMLEVYSRWLTQHVERRSEGLAGWADETKQTDGASGDIPSLDSVRRGFFLPSLSGHPVFRIELSCAIPAQRGLLSPKTQRQTGAEK